MPDGIGISYSVEVFAGDRQIGEVLEVEEAGAVNQGVHIQIRNFGGTLVFRHFSKLRSCEKL